MTRIHPKRLSDVDLAAITARATASLGTSTFGPHRLPEAARDRLDLLRHIAATSSTPTTTTGDH
ncbi:MAG: hypothetical protein PGN13_15945 [Patulibacter minatonensis]